MSIEPRREGETEVGRRFSLSTSRTSPVFTTGAVPDKEGDTLFDKVGQGRSDRRQTSGLSSL